jgi:hypothetical protein
MRIYIRGLSVDSGAEGAAENRTPPLCHFSREYINHLHGGIVDSRTSPDSLRMMTPASFALSSSSAIPAGHKRLPVVLILYKL